MVALTTAGLFSATQFLMKVPELGRLSELSKVIRSENGEVINLRLTSSGHWREPTDLNRVDPLLLEMLVAYEDKRFWNHHGVDPLAIIRASISFAKSGRVQSGASTLTMQTVKLMHPDLRQRTVKCKIKQMLAAVRLDAHWSKTEILEVYY